jgi:hypothetical protein
LNPIPATPESLNPKATEAYYNNWGLRVFLCSTFFIVIFSVTAIHSWPPLVKHVSILLACILPIAIIVLPHYIHWIPEKKPQKEVLWVQLVFILGIAVSLQSENLWKTMKSTVLFMASGPFIFIATKYLFESIKSQEVFLWTTTLILLSFGFFGFYEYNNSGHIILFSENPLPAGASLILLSTSPTILLTRNCSAPLRLTLILSLISSAILIILLTKKGPILTLVVILLFVIVFITRKHLKLLLGFALLTGCLFLTSESTLSKYKSNFKINSSITMRAEHYFFGFHVFKKNPVWGLGYHPNLFKYFYCEGRRHNRNREQYPEDIYHPRFCNGLFSYDLIFLSQQRGRYWGYYQTFRSFENIVLTFLVEMGGLFSAIYFGGVIYIFIVFFKKFRAPPQKNLAGMYTIAVMVGFAFISCTFDTLRFPNLNWLFHSFLGLMVNLPQNSSEKQPESG